MTLSPRTAAFTSALVAAGLGGCGGAAQPDPARPLSRLTPLPPWYHPAPAGTALPPAPIPLSTGWRYRADPGNVGSSQNWATEGSRTGAWAAVSVPSVFNPKVVPAGEKGSVGWYATTFTGPPMTPDRGWAVAFESVRRHAMVWLNGRQLGASNDPYSPFQLPAAGLRPGRPNLLVVRVDNVKGPRDLPEDWWNWGGITGPVRLVPTGRLLLTGLGVEPRLGCELRCGSMSLQASVTNQWTRSLMPSVRVSVTGPAGVRLVTLQRRLGALAPGHSEALSLPVKLPAAPHLWSPAHPSLYSVQVDTLAQGRVEQRQQVRTGLRSVAVRHAVLYLNGRRLWLHGAAIHEDVAGRGAALSDADIAKIVSQLRSVGANITRTHYLLSPRLLDALDAAGIMVWAQPPVDHAAGALATAAGRGDAMMLLLSTLLGNRSHPSVIVNSIGNELTPTPDTAPGVPVYLRQASAMARQLDPGVPVALDTYCYPGLPVQNTYRQLDVLGISSYFGWYRGIAGHGISHFSGLRPFLVTSHRRYPEKALVVSEYGAEGLFRGPATVKGSYAFQSDYLRRTLRLLDRLPFMSGSIYWTLREFAVSPGWRGGAQLPPGRAPDGIHHKGLIAYGGAIKPAFAVAKQLFGKLPAFVRGGV